MKGIVKDRQNEREREKERERERERERKRERAKERLKEATISYAHLNLNKLYIVTSILYCL